MNSKPVEALPEVEQDLETGTLVLAVLDCRRDPGQIRRLVRNRRNSP